MAKVAEKVGSSPPKDGVSGDVRWRPLLWSAAALILIFGLLRVIQNAWVSDDAFISFRYAKNLLDGHGLVYNAGEVVEGYSNFLWTLIIAAGMRLGADPVRLSEVLGAVCYVATIFALVRTSLRSAAERGRRGVVLPLAALALSLNAHVAIFATGGLETSLFTLEMTALTVLLVQAARPRDYLAAGMVGVAIAMTRPDGALYYALAAAVTAHDSLRGRSWKPLASLLLPGVVLYLPYFAWRLAYYGYVFPNTFYAKAAGSPYVSQGLLYVWLYLRCYYVLAVALVALPVLLVRRRRREAARADARAPWSGPRAPALILVLVAGNLFFVIWSGGDFMFARFLIPATPLLYLGLELVVGGIVALRWRLLAVAAVLLTTVVTWYPGEIKNLLNTTGIVEERAFYPRERIAEARRVGEQLKSLLAGTDTRVVIFGMQAMLAYYAEFPLVIEGEAGLTDEYVAHLPIRERSRIGHEKRAPVEYLRDRGVDFLFVWPQAVPTAGFSDIDFGIVKGQVVTYRKAVMDRLKGKPGVQFWDFEAYLKDYTKTLSDLPREKAQEEYEFWKSVYLQHNNDPALEAAFIAALAGGGQAPAEPPARAPTGSGNPPGRP